MKKFLVLMCALFLTQAALAGKGAVIPGGTSASTVTVVVDGGGSAGGGGAAGDSGDGGSNISPAATPSLANVAAAISSGAPISITGSPAQLAALQNALASSNLGADVQAAIQSALDDAAG